MIQSSPYIISITIITIIIYLITPSYGQNSSSNNYPTVDPFATCQSYTGIFCKKYLLNSSSIWVPFNKTQEEFEINAIKTLLSLPIMGEYCANDHTYKIICNMLFQPCIKAPLPAPSINGITSIALFQSQCNQDCHRLFSDCPRMASKSNITCEDIIPRMMVDMFPMTSNSFNLSRFNGTSNFTVQCSVTDSIVGCPTCFPFHPICSPPFTYMDRNDTDIKDGYKYLDGTQCVFPCPYPVFDKSQFHSIFLVSNIFGVLGFILSIFMIITFGVLDRKQDRHTRCILYMCICGLLMTFTDLALFHQGFDFLCDDGVRFRQQHLDVACPATGFLFTFGGLGLIFWWGTAAFDLWLVLRNLNTTASYEKIYTPIAFGVSLLLALVPLSDDQYGYSGGSLQCFLRDQKWQIGAFWTPYCVVLFAGLIFVSLIFREVYKVVVRTDDGRKKSIRLIRFNLKPFILLMVFMVEFFYEIIFNFYSTTRNERISEKMKEYVSCVYTLGEDNCSPSGILPFGPHAVANTIRVLQPIQIFLIFGLTRRTAKIWFESSIFENRFFSFKKFISFASTSWNSSSNNMNTQTTKQSEMSIHSKSQTNQNTIDCDSDSSSSGSYIDSLPSPTMNNVNNNNNNTNSPRELEPMSSISSISEENNVHQQEVEELEDIQLNDKNININNNTGGNMSI